MTVEGAVKNVARIRSIVGVEPALENIATLLPTARQFSRQECYIYTEATLGSRGESDLLPNRGSHRAYLGD